MSDVGPDRIIETNEIRTWEREGAVRLRLQSSDDIKPESIPTFVKNRCTKAGNRTALCVKKDGQWQKWSYNEYYRDIRQAAKAFIRNGLEPFHSVAIYGFNSPEWFFSSFGAVFAGKQSPSILSQMASNEQRKIIVG